MSVVCNYDASDSVLLSATVCRVYAFECFIL